VIALVVALVAIASPAHAYLDPARFDAPAIDGGAGGRSFTGAPRDGYGCSVCHRGGTPPAVEITGIPDEGWDPGRTYELVVAMPEGVRSAGAAIEIADQEGDAVGTLALVPVAEQQAADQCARDPLRGLAATAIVPVPDRLIARTTVCGAERARVRWTAPAEPVTGVRVFAAMVASDDSGDPSGDGASVTARPLRARGAPDVEGAVLSARCSAAAGGPFAGSVPLVAASAWVLLRRRRTRPAPPGA
jgi:hypothetical protein